jgi:PKD repeat protein
VLDTNGNPLVGRQVWSGNSGGFTTTVVNLPAAAAGQNAQLRWRSGAGNVPSNSVASSGTLAYWNFDNVSTITIANLTATNITAAPVAVSNVSGPLTNFAGNPSTGKAIASSGFTTLAGPPTSSYSYFSFALTVSNGSLASLSKLSFDDRASGTGPAHFDVQISQLANFSSVIYDSGALSDHGTFTATPMNSLTLTNSGLTGTVYFRIYAYGAGGSGGTWRIDNLTVQGSVAGAGGATGIGWYIDSVSISDFACCTAPTNNPPVASFSASPTNGVEPLVVTFTDTSTGNITNRFWNFGDSSTTNVTTNSVAHTYAAGTNTVTLVVSGLGGVSTNTQANYITVLTAFQNWQIQYFGSTTNPAAAPTADPDGDGQNNTAEFLAGTDPTNGASTFRITSIAREGDDFRITWMTGIGRTNALQVAPGDAGGSYSNDFTDLFVVTNTVGTATNYLDLGAATNTPAGYYRVRLVP